MTNDSIWTVREDGFDPARLHQRETLYTIGNGYLCSRGAFEEGYPHAEAATFIHNVFDDIPTFYTELANAPDWTALELRLAGERFSLAEGQILNYQRSLDLRNGLLSRWVRWRSPAGRTADLAFERFASLSDPHTLFVRAAVTPLDFSGEVEVRAGMNAWVDSHSRLHWDWIDQETTPTRASFQLRTRASRIDLGMAMRLDLQGDRETNTQGWDARGQPTLVAAFPAKAGERVVAEKVVTVYTSNEAAEPWTAARQKLSELPSPGWAPCLEIHQAAWEREWQACDVVIEGDEAAQLAMRFNLYHLLIAAPRQDYRASIGAKTLSGYGYRGHVFWDTEIFMLPFFTYTRPEIARNLLSYRCHTLPGARRKARAGGYQGAQYAWESAATGDEVTPVWIPHFEEPQKLVRIWTGDIEIHGSADIAYAIRQYWHMTSDHGFMLAFGMEIFLDTARFWASRAEWDGARERYGFSDVIGPDEYHDHVDNNAYTNTMARWHLLTALEILEWGRANYPQQTEELLQRLEISSAETGRWRQVAQGIYLPLDPDSGLIEQFEGYFHRRDVDLSEYSGRTRSMQAILGIEGANETQVLKQPDVLMLFFLHPEMFDPEILRANYNYYNARTDHSYGSSLGPAIQAIIACRLGEVEQAYEHFMRAANTDLHDLRGNTRDGFHGATAGGVWQAAVFGFAGLSWREDEWRLNPRLPAHWRRLAFKFYWKGEQQTVDILREGTGYAIRKGPAV